MKKIVSVFMLVTMLTTNLSFATESVIYDRGVDGSRKSALVDWGMDSGKYRQHYLQETTEIDNIVNKFEPTKTKGDKEQLQEIAVYVESLKMKYGGNVSKQLDYIDNNTMCEGVSVLIARLLEKTEIPHRIAFIYTYDPTQAFNIDYKGTGHQVVEVKMSDGKWYVFEGTVLLNDDTRKEALINYKYIETRETTTRWTENNLYIIHPVFVGDKMVDENEQHILITDDSNSGNSTTFKYFR